MSKLPLLLFVASLSGCEVLDGLTDDLNVGKPGWTTLGQHPCTSYRLNALHVEDDGQTMWLGCGEGAEGFGLFTSVDGGRTWDAPETAPFRYFDTFRVNHVTRSADGALYVAGTQNPGSVMVARVDTGAAPFSVTSVLERGTTVDNSFQVGTFWRAPSGAALAESLTGYGLLYRASDSAPFVPVDGWANDAGSYQLLDTALHDGAFYGAGSTISDSFKVFVPPAEPGAGFSLDVVDFPNTKGEMWGVAVDDGGVAAAGVEQSTNHAVVITGPLGTSDASAFTLHDLRPVLRLDDSSRLYGVCRRGDTILALGDYSRRSNGLALLSTNGGATFTEVTTGEERDGLASPTLDKCVIIGNNSAIVGGGGGFIARLGW